MSSFWCCFCVCFWSQTGYFTSTPQERQVCLKLLSWFTAGLCNTVLKILTRHHLDDCFTLCLFALCQQVLSHRCVWISLFRSAARWCCLLLPAALSLRRSVCSTQTSCSTCSVQLIEHQITKNTLNNLHSSDINQGCISQQHIKPK